jgi:hypothetical protein
VSRRDYFFSCLNILLLRQCVADGARGPRQSVNPSALQLVHAQSEAFALTTEETFNGVDPALAAYEYFQWQFEVNGKRPEWLPDDPEISCVGGGVRKGRQ